MSTAICSSGSCVLPARNTMSSSAKPASCAERARARVVAVGLGAVVFERAGDVDALGRRAERAEALGRFVVLRGDQIDLPQHAGRRAAECGGSRESCWSLSRPLMIATRAPCRFGGARSGSATAPARPAPAASAGCAASPSARPN